MMPFNAWRHATKRAVAAAACSSLAVPALSASICSASADAQDAAGDAAADKSPAAAASAVQVRPELHAAAKLDLDRVQDWESFREHGHKMVDFIADYYKSVHTRPVKAEVEPGYLQKRLPQAAPDKPESFDAVMQDVTQHIMPGVTHWQHPGFLAYFPANTSVPGLLGDMLSGMFNVIGFSWVASPACTELEGVVMDWLHDLLGLPVHFHSSGKGGGVIQGTASEATAVALLAALSRAHARRPEGVSQQDWASKFVVYTSDQAHSSVKKAAMVAGVPLSQFRALPASSAAPPACLADSGFTDRNFSLQGSTLRRAVEADVAAGLVPVFACGTLGSTSTGAFDDLRGLGKVCKQFDMWMHVDAAWAGSALVVPELRPLGDGLELADSFDFNPHKWLLTNFDCSAMWVADKKHLLQALSLTPEYLRSKEYEEGNVQDYRDWQIPLGRRFRSLKLFFVLRMFGADALRTYIREHCILAEQLTALVKADSRFELTAPTALSLVCFKVAGDDDAGTKGAALLDAVNATGRVFAVHTKVNGQFMIRLAIGNPRHTKENIAEAWSVVQEVADKVLK